MNYNKLLGYALSNFDVMDMLDNKTKVISYGDLGNFKDIDDLFYPYDNVILLYETKPNYGHYCCVFKTPNDAISFFDSYGMNVDDQKNYISKNFLRKSGQGHPYLSKMLLDSKKKIEYNPYELQSEDEGVSTCGRWCVTRIKEKHLNPNQFYKKYKDNGDIKVIEFTEKLKKTI